MDFGEAIVEWAASKFWLVNLVSGFVIYSLGVVKIIKDGKDIISDGLSWVVIEFLVCGEVSNIVDEGIRATLNLFFFFFKKRFHTHKKHKKHKKNKKPKKHKKHKPSNKRFFSS